VRLRRTIAVATLLVLVATVGARLATRGPATPERVADPRITRAADVAAPTAAGRASDDADDAQEGASPARATVPQHGNGRLTVVQVPRAAVASTGRTVRYTVEVEGGLGVDVDDVARTVQSVLLDTRGWQRVDGVRFVNVTPEQEARGAHIDIRVTLASPDLTDTLCAPLTTKSQVSCWNGARSVLNYRRWALGDDSYGTDVARYRIYQVNHEVGHGLGHGHQSCPSPGRRAPVMVQQTLDLGGCTAWPYPSGA
jgi:hypothetical protein